MAAWIDYLVAFLMGAMVGTAELIARYRDEPRRALMTIPAIFYLLLNALAAVVALGLIRVFGWSFGATGDALHWTQVLAAGFGSMALFRTSLFVVRAGNEDIGIGPNGFLQVLLAAADRGVDRLRAQDRAPRVGAIMAAVSFDKAYEALPAHCLALMQNLSQEEQKRLAEQVGKLRDSKMSAQLKTQLLGLALMNAVGEDVLQASVQALSKEIELSPLVPPSPRASP
jgi:hypothetical protein